MRFFLKHINSRTIDEKPTFCWLTIFVAQVRIFTYYRDLEVGLLVLNVQQKSILYAACRITCHGKVFLFAQKDELPVFQKCYNDLKLYKTIPVSVEYSFFLTVIYQKKETEFWEVWPKFTIPSLSKVKWTSLGDPKLGLKSLSFNVRAYLPSLRPRKIVSQIVDFFKISRIFGVHYLGNKLYVFMITLDLRLRSSVVELVAGQWFFVDESIKVITQKLSD